VPLGVSDERLAERFALIRTLVAKDRPVEDPEPSLVGEHLFVGSRHHAGNVEQLKKLNISAVLNCAPTGIRNLSLEEFESANISYHVTNVRRDDATYPLLHDRQGQRSHHLVQALEVYERARATGGRAMFFCVAGQNRSATLAVAVLLLAQHPLNSILTACSERRPFILENQGFQQQLIELEAMIAKDSDSSDESMSSQSVIDEVELRPMKRLRSAFCCTCRSESCRECQAIAEPPTLSCA